MIVTRNGPGNISVYNIKSIHMLGVLTSGLRTPMSTLFMAILFL
jgi:hypothetical protein